MKEVAIYRDFGAVDMREIEAFEAQLGYRFPAEYKKLMSQHNALRPSDNCFDFKLKNKVDSRDVNFFGYGVDIADSINIARNQQEKDQYYRDHVVIIGESANGDYICFDYRENPTTDNPPVVVMLHDYLDEDNKMLVCFVADSFERFIDSLYSD